MLVRSITGSNFGGFRERPGASARELHLADTGVTLITGPNGSGKSTFIEAVSWTLWGKPVRGDTLNIPDTASSAKVHVGNIWCERARTKSGKLSLRWGPVKNGIEQAALPYESNTHAQAALDERIDSYAQWVRTCVFTTTAGVTEFLSSTDTERRDILERLCGLEQFAAGQKRLRSDLKDGTDKLSTLRMKKASRDAAIAQARTALDSGRLMLDSVRAQVPAAPPVGAEGEAPVSYAELNRLEQEVGAIQMQLNDAQRRSRRPYAPSTACGQCQRPYENASAALEQHAREVAIADTATHEAAGHSDRLASHRGNYNVILGRYQEWQARANEGARLRAVAASHAGSVAAAEANVERMMDAVVEIMMTPDPAAELTAQQQLVDELGGADKVLGARGVRSVLLSNLIAALSASAQQWVHRLVSPNQNINIRATSTTQGGDLVMKIDVELSGMIHSYTSASQGQQRRLDLAVLLAISTFGTSDDSTIWFDEVLDGIDAAGMDEISEVILELAETRPIVVITHSERVIGNLSARSNHMVL